MPRSSRNHKIIDKWSLVHVLVAGGMTLWIGPVPTLIIVTLWEPFEVLVLSPLLAKVGITFGYESLRNSLSDIVFNGIGVLGALLLT